MAQEPSTGSNTTTLTVTDPGNVPEVYSNGPINISIVGPCAVITFCNVRADVADIGNGGQPKFDKAVVASRMVIPAESMGAIRDMIDQMIPRGGTMKPIMPIRGSAPTNGTGH